MYIFNTNIISLKWKVHKIEIFHLKIFLNNIKYTFEVIKYFLISIFS